MPNMPNSNINIQGNFPPQNSNMPPFQSNNMNNMNQNMNMKMNVNGMPGPNANINIQGTGMQPSNQYPYNQPTYP